MDSEADRPGGSARPRPIPRSPPSGSSMSRRWAAPSAWPSCAIAPQAKHDRADQRLIQPDLRPCQSHRNSGVGLRVPRLNVMDIKADRKVSAHPVRQGRHREDGPAGERGHPLPARLLQEHLAAAGNLAIPRRYRPMNGNMLCLIWRARIDSSTAFSTATLQRGSGSDPARHRTPTESGCRLLENGILSTDKPPCMRAGVNFRPGIQRLGTRIDRPAQGAPSGVPKPATAKPEDGCREHAMIVARPWTRPGQPFTRAERTSTHASGAAIARATQERPPLDPGFAALTAGLRQGRHGLVGAHRSIPMEWLVPRWIDDVTGLEGRLRRLSKNGPDFRP